MVWDTSCDATHLCSNVRITIDTAKNFTFWIVVNADGGVQATYGVFVIVRCGLEDMSITTPAYSQVWAPNKAANASPYLLNMVTDGISAMFVSTLSQCYTVEYNLYNDFDLQWPILDNTTMSLENYQNPSTTYISVNPANALNR